MRSVECTWVAHAEQKLDDERVGIDCDDSSTSIVVVGGVTVTPRGGLLGVTWV